jgi:hypothetical protein
MDSRTPDAARGGVFASRPFATRTRQDLDNCGMATQSAPPIIERRVTAWHEAGHVIAVLASKHFDVGDPAIDLRPSSRGHAYANAKRLFMSARVTEAEAREIVKIAYAGSIGEDWLHRISRDEGQTIHPGPAGAHGDLKLAESVLIEHGLQGERETLWTAAQDAVGDHALALVKLADQVWKSPSDLLSRAELLAIPEISGLMASVQKESPPQPDPESAVPKAQTDRQKSDSGTNMQPAQDAATAEPKIGFWRRAARLLPFK